MEVTVNQIRVPRVGVVGDRGLVPRPVASTLPALAAHDPLHGAAGHVVALATQSNPQLARPQGLHELPVFLSSRWAVMISTSSASRNSRRVGALVIHS
jgi:hypothetical protein